MCDLRWWITQIINKQWALSCLNVSCLLLDVLMCSHSLGFLSHWTILCLLWLIPLCQFSWPCITCSSRRTCVEQCVLKQCNDFRLILRNCCISRVLPIFIRVVTSNRLCFFFCFFLIKPFSSLLTRSRSLENTVRVRAKAATSSGLAWTEFTSVVNDLFLWSCDIAKNKIWRLKFYLDESCCCCCWIIRV